VAKSNQVGEIKSQHYSVRLYVAIFCKVDRAITTRDSSVNHLSAFSLNIKGCVSNGVHVVRGLRESELLRRMCQRVVPL